MAEFVPLGGSVTTCIGALLLTTPSHFAFVVHPALARAVAELIRSSNFDVMVEFHMNNCISNDIL